MTSISRSSDLSKMASSGESLRGCRSSIGFLESQFQGHECSWNVASVNYQRKFRRNVCCRIRKNRHSIRRIFRDRGGRGASIAQPGCGGCGACIAQPCCGGRGACIAQPGCGGRGACIAQPCCGGRRSKSPSLIWLG